MSEREYNVPKEAKAAILHIVNEGDTKEEVSFRIKGKEEPYTTFHLEPHGQAQAIIPLVDGRFQAKVSSLKCRIYLQGYTT